MDMSKLQEVFDGARYVRVDEELQVILVWCGGTYVNIYSADGYNFDCYSSAEGLTADTIAQSMADHLDEMRGVICSDCGNAVDRGEYNLCPVCLSQE